MSPSNANPNANTDTDTDTNTSQLEHFPVTFFSVVMGLTGLAIAWRLTALSSIVATGLAYLALGVFLVIACFYLAKLLRFPAAVKAELNHPIRLNFFGAISVSLILLSTAFIDLSTGLSKILWLVGASAQFCVLMYVVNAWIHRESFKHTQLNPAWFIPAVGNVLVAGSGVDHQFVEVSWFFFSVGIMFWLVLLSVIFNRILFHLPLPAKLLPTLFILIAPPAVGFTGYVKLTGQFDQIAHILYYNALFFTLLMLSQSARFARLPFSLASWAYSFPLTAIASASWLIFERSQIDGFRWISLALLAISTGVIAVLSLKTLAAIRAKTICVPE